MPEDTVEELTNSGDAYFLDIDAPEKTIYLGQTQIDLIEITELSSPEELANYVENCAQFVYTPQEIDKLKASFPESKKEIFATYCASIPQDYHSKNDAAILIRNFDVPGMDEAEIDEVMDLYLNGYTKTALEVISKQDKSILTEIKNNFFRRQQADYDDIKYTTYEEIENLGKHLSDFNCLLITSGKYSCVENSQRFDDYHIRRGLNFAKKHNLQVRYHSLLTKDMPRDLDVEAIKQYVKDSIDFISKYNSENTVEVGSEQLPVIRSVDLMNEIISMTPNEKGEYGNIWEKRGISIPILGRIFAYAKEHKPEGITYVYNEAFVELPEKRAKQIEMARTLAANGLIDTFGTQMHISINTKREDIEAAFRDLKNLQEESGLSIAITEFDCYVPHKKLDRIIKVTEDKTKIKEIVGTLKKDKLKDVEEAAEKANLSFSEVGYWSSTDSMDHNKRRARQNGATKKENFKTLYGGLYGDSLRTPEVKKQPVQKEQVPEIDTMLQAPLASTPIPTFTQSVPTKIETPKTYTKKNTSSSQKSSSSTEQGFVNVPVLLIMGLILISVMYLLLGL